MVLLDLGVMLMVSDLSTRKKCRRNTAGGVFAAILFITTTQSTADKHQRQTAFTPFLLKHQNTPAEWPRRDWQISR